MVVVVPSPASAGNIDISEFLSDLSRNRNTQESSALSAIGAHVARESDAILAFFTSLDDPDLEELAQKLNMSSQVLKSAQMLTKEMESMQSDYLNKFKDHLHGKHSARRTSWGKFHVLDCVCSHIAESIKKEAQKRKDGGEGDTAVMRRAIRDQMVSAVVQRLLASNQKRNKTYKTMRQVEEARRVGAAVVIQRNWREFKVLQREKVDKISRRREAAGELERNVIKDVAAADRRRTRSAYRHAKRKEKFIGNLQAIDVNHVDNNPDVVELPEDNKTPSRTIEEVEALFLADLEALLEASCREELSIDSKDAIELWRESQALDPLSSNDASLSPQKKSRAHSKVQKPKMSVRLEELSKPTSVRKFRNRDLLAAALSRSAEMSNSSSGSSMQLSLSSVLNKNGDQERELMADKLEEEDSDASRDSAALPVSSAWGTHGENLDSSETNRNATMVGGIRRGLYNRVPTYVERRKARLDELSIGTASERTSTGVRYLPSSRHPTILSHHSATAPHIQKKSNSEKLLLGKLDDFDTVVAGAGRGGFLSNPANAASALMDHHRQSKLLLQTMNKLGESHQQQEANVQRMRRPSTSDGSIQQAQHRRKSIGGQTSMASRNPLGLPPRKNNSFRMELGTGLRDKRFSGPSMAGEQNPFFQVSFAAVRRQHRRSLPAIL